MLAIGFLLVALGALLLYAGITGAKPIASAQEFLRRR